MAILHRQSQYIEGIHRDPDKVTVTCSWAVKNTKEINIERERAKEGTNNFSTNGPFCNKKGYLRPKHFAILRTRGVPPQLPPCLCMSMKCVKKGKVW